MRQTKTTTQNFIHTKKKSVKLRCDDFDLKNEKVCNSISISYLHSIWCAWFCVCVQQIRWVMRMRDYEYLALNMYNVFTRWSKFNAMYVNDDKFSFMCVLFHLWKSSSTIFLLSFRHLFLIRFCCLSDGKEHLPA